MAERPLANQASPTGTSDFEKGLAQAPFALTGAPPAPPRGEEIFQLRQFHPSELDSMKEDERRDRYQGLLGPFTELLFASADRHKIPPQLLAAIILNELNEIGPQDVFDDAVTRMGSLGMAQIQVQTAREHDLVDLPSPEALQSFDNAAAAAAFVEASRVETRLRQPKFAIEAAARYIRHLLTEMTRHVDAAWQVKHGFELGDIALLKAPQDLYRFIRGPDQVVREQLAAVMVASAYNSPDIVRAQAGSIEEGGPAFIYSDGVTHGGNAAGVAKSLAIPPPMFRR